MLDPLSYNMLLALFVMVEFFSFALCTISFYLPKTALPNAGISFTICFTAEDHKFFSTELVLEEKADKELPHAHNQEPLTISSSTPNFYQQTDLKTRWIIAPGVESCTVSSVTMKPLHPARKCFLYTDILPYYISVGDYKVNVVFSNPMDPRWKLLVAQSDSSIRIHSLLPIQPIVFGRQMMGLWECQIKLQHVAATAVEAMERGYFPIICIRYLQVRDALELEHEKIRFLLFRSAGLVYGTPIPGNIVAYTKIRDGLDLFMLRFFNGDRTKLRRLKSILTSSKMERLRSFLVDFLGDGHDAYLREFDHYIRIYRMPRIAHSLS